MTLNKNTVIFCSIAVSQLYYIFLSMHCICFFTYIAKLCLSTFPLGLIHENEVSSFNNKKWESTILPELKDYFMNRFYGINNIQTVISLIKIYNFNTQPELIFYIMY